MLADCTSHSAALPRLGLLDDLTFSYYPLLRSRWRLCRLTDAACPLRVVSALQVGNLCGTHSAARGLQVCHCEEAAGRRGALSAKREEVPLGCNLGKAVTFSPEVPNYPAKYCEIPTSLRSSE